MLPFLQALHTRLDTVLLSHCEADHVGGAPAVLGMQLQAMLLNSLASDARLQNLRPVQCCVAGQNWEWDGVQFDIMHTQAADYGKPHKPNAVSCVLRIQSVGPQSQTALLVGDIERPHEDHLLAAQAALKADVLLVPHQGSKTSSSEAFLAAVQPRQAWVQAVYCNRYGHPALEVM